MMHSLRVSPSLSLVLTPSHHTNPFPVNNVEFLENISILHTHTDLVFHLNLSKKRVKPAEMNTYIYTNLVIHRVDNKTLVITVEHEGHLTDVRFSEAGQLKTNVGIMTRHRGLGKAASKQRTWEYNLFLLRRTWDSNLFHLRRTWDYNLFHLRRTWDSNLFHLRRAWDSNLFHLRRIWDIRTWDMWDMLFAGSGALCLGVYLRVLRSRSRVSGGGV
jgi:hypothetical protein